MIIGLPITKAMTKRTMGIRKEVESRIVKGIIETVRTKAIIPMSGALKNIELFNQLGIPMAVASSSYMEIIEAALGKIGVRKYIRVIHSAELRDFEKADMIIDSLEDFTTESLDYFKYPM